MYYDDVRKLQIKVESNVKDRLTYFLLAVL